jgi:NTP pyrophosphatase (non-canonical NTP hydrolase)
MSALECRLEEFFHDVREEIAVTTPRFPDSKHRLAALMEEVGELSTALLEGEGTQRVYDEAKQVAATAAKIALEGDRSFDK